MVNIYDLYRLVIYFDRMYVLLQMLWTFHELTYGF